MAVNVNISNTNNEDLLSTADKVNAYIETLMKKIPTFGWMW
jgi:hypothetical protein